MPEETAFALTEEAGILTLTMSAPGNNLMTGAFFREYEAIMDQVQLRSTQPGIRGLIIRSGGRHFSVGADVDAETEKFLNWLDVFGERNNIKFTVTISGDVETATDGMRKYL